MASPGPAPHLTGQSEGPTVLFMTYGVEAASYRYRIKSLFPTLAAAGWRIAEHELARGRYGLRIWRLSRQLRAADLVVLQKIKLLPPEARLLRGTAQRLVFDLDDAIFVRKPRRPGGRVGDSAWRRWKFASTCRAADLVTVGNHYLATVAGRSARRVEILPTAVDHDRYPSKVVDVGQPPTVVWIGQPENLMSLELVRPAVARVAQRVPGSRLRVVCSDFPDWDEVPVERTRWRPDSEVAALSSADVGIMPIEDEPWSRGKCAFKLLQYMAAGLPCVASPVGANRDVVVHGETGFLATDTASWTAALGRLLTEPELRHRMGEAGRRRVESEFSIDDYAETYVGHLMDLAKGGSAGPAPTSHSGHG